jgi:hypothetical protein
VLTSLLIVSAFATTPKLDTIPEVRHVKAPSIAASFGGALLGTAAGLALGTLLDSGEVAGIAAPALTVAGAALPATLMTDGRAGYVTLGAGIGMASGFVAGVSIGAAIGSSANPSDGFSSIIGAGIGGAILGSLGAATGALVAAGMDIKNQDRYHWAVSPTYDLRQQTAGVVFRGRF